MFLGGKNRDYSVSVIGGCLSTDLKCLEKQRKKQEQLMKNENGKVNASKNVNEKEHGVDYLAPDY